MYYYTIIYCYLGIELEVMCYSGERKEGDNIYQSRHELFTMYGVFNIYTDILDYTFLKLGRMWIADEDLIKNKPGARTFIHHIHAVSRIHDKVVS